jgi:selenocysteine lyase/cysteine desulfurase
MFPIEWVRKQFPSLQLDVGDKPAVYLDGPGGTQVPEQVIRYNEPANRRFG